MKKGVVVLITVLVALCCARLYYTREGNAGERLYLAHCANCHGKVGEGLRGVIPPLAQSDYLRQHFQKLPCLIRHGLSDSIVVNGKLYHGNMPPNTVIKEQELVQLIRFFVETWKIQAPPPSYQEIHEQLKTCNP